MNYGEKITTEIIQRITPADAWAYGIVPYGETEGRLNCFANDNMDWQSLKPEAEVVIGEKLEITLTDTREIEILLNRYYRQSGKRENIGVFSAEGKNFVADLIREAFRNYASDIHLESYEDRCRIRLRIDGKLIERYVIDRQQYPATVNQIKIMANLDISEKRLPQDGRIFYQSGEDKFDVRVSCLPTIYGEKVVLRLLTRHEELLELSNLGFSVKQKDDYIRAVSKPHGLVLISGPTGSGKSTTLYATLRMLNRDCDNILTIEDPVEYTLGGVNQVQLKEEIGLTFGSALRTFLRQDPDIIMLGEIRDADTAQMAIRSSLTGHLIFSTIHTNSAWGSIARMVDMGVHPYLISNTLVLCVAQRLVRLLCPHCKKTATAGEHIWSLSNKLAGIESYYEASGCEKCFYTGYKGRRAIYEVIPIDKELTEAIRSTKEDISDLMRSRGIVSLRESAITLFAGGLTSLEELIPQLK